QMVAVGLPLEDRPGPSLPQADSATPNGRLKERPRKVRRVVVLNSTLLSVNLCRARAVAPRRGLRARSGSPGCRKISLIARNGLFPESRFCFLDVSTLVS